MRLEASIFSSAPVSDVMECAECEASNVAERMRDAHALLSSRISVTEMAQLSVAPKDGPAQAEPGVEEAPSKVDGTLRSEGHAVLQDMKCGAISASSAPWH